jgi:hypothetical protein
MVGTVVLILMISSCGGGGTGEGGVGTIPGTPPGTYNVIVAVTSGKVTHTSTIALTVN